MLYRHRCASFILFIFLFALCCMCISGCTKTITETKVEYIKPEIPASIIKPCDSMPENTSISTNGELLMLYISLQSMYIICSSKVTSIANILNSYNSIYNSKESSQLVSLSD